MRILVTGAGGFIGRRIVDRLLLKGNHHVLGTGTKSRKSNQANYSYVRGDLTKYEDCERLTHEIDVVIHCAGKAGTWGPYSEYEAANVRTTNNLLHACRMTGVRRFVNLSSGSIYFDYRHQFDLKESYKPKVFSSAYAETKFVAERLVTEAHSNKLNTVSLRPRGVLGAGDQTWLPRIIALRKANRLIQPGRGQTMVDFTAVENLVDAVELCLITPSENCGRAYNITDGAPVNLWEFTEYALSLLGLDGRRWKVPLSLAMATAKIVEKYHILRNTQEEPSLLPIKVGVAAYSMTMDISDAINRLGYQPLHSSRESVREFASSRR